MFTMQPMLMLPCMCCSCSTHCSCAAHACSQSTCVGLRLHTMISLTVVLPAKRTCQQLVVTMSSHMCHMGCSYHPATPAECLLFSMYMRLPGRGLHQCSRRNLNLVARATMSLPLPTPMMISPACTSQQTSRECNRPHFLPLHQDGATPPVQEALHNSTATEASASEAYECVQLPHMESASSSCHSYVMHI
jgi:hypothetical protein